MPALKPKMDPTMRAVLDRALFGPDWSVPAGQIGSESGQLQLAWLGAKEALKQFHEAAETARSSGHLTPTGIQAAIMAAADAAKARLNDMREKVVLPSSTRLAYLRGQAKAEMRGVKDPVEAMTAQMRAQEIRQHLLSVDDTAFLQIAYAAKADSDLEVLQAIQGIPKFVRNQIPTFDTKLAQVIDEAVATLTIDPETRQKIQALEDPINRVATAQAGVLREIEAELGTDPLAAILAKANQSTEENGDE